MSGAFISETLVQRGLYHLNLELEKLDEGDTSVFRDRVSVSSPSGGAAAGGCGVSLMLLAPSLLGAGATLLVGGDRRVARCIAGQRAP